MSDYNIRGNKVSLKTYFDENFLSKFTFNLPEDIENSCSHAILFTDIISSSQIYHERGDHYGLLMASQKYEIAAFLSHDEEFLGSIKIIKSMGDALFIICENVVVAFRFTLKLIKQLKETSKKTDINLRIRSTLHYGKFLIYTPIFQNNVDCFGEVINNTARLEGENKRLINEHHSGIQDNYWNEYPLLLSDEFYSELTKEIEIPAECSEPKKVKIREYYNKEFIAYLIKYDCIKLK